MKASSKHQPDLDLIHVNVASTAGAYTVGNASFFRYILRLGELGLPLSLADQEAVDVLAAVPARAGPGGRDSFDFGARLASRAGPGRAGLAGFGSDARAAA